MPARNQAPILSPRSQRLAFRRRMDELHLNYTKIAVKVDHDLSVVSKAINHGHFPRVVAKIRRLLYA